MKLNLYGSGTDMDAHSVPQQFIRIWLGPNPIPEMFQEWWKDFIPTFATKSEAMKSWDNGVGDEIISDMEWSFRRCLQKKMDDIIDAEEEQQRIEEESEPNDFDRLGDLQMETLMKEVA